MVMPRVPGYRLRYRYPAMRVILSILRSSDRAGPAPLSGCEVGSASGTRLGCLVLKSDMVPGSCTNDSNVGYGGTADRRPVKVLSLSSHVTSTP
eukprot:2159875-Rhodomonas_salina.1